MKIKLHCLKEGIKRDTTSLFHVRWLKLNHPVVLPVNMLLPTLNSVVDAFSDVSPPLHSIS